MSAAERLEPLRPRLLVAADAARYCGVAREAVWRLEGFPKPIRLNGPSARPYWDVRDLDAWIDARKAEGEKPAPGDDNGGLTNAQVTEIARSVVASARRSRRGLPRDREGARAPRGSR